MNLRAALLAAASAFTFACSSPALPGEAVEATTAPVVGGRLETGYSPVGYMTIGKDVASLKGPYCGATLISSDVAVTAAHCVRDEITTSSFGMGLGSVGQGLMYVARKVVMHPDYDPAAFVRYRHDIAVLFLTTKATVTPVTIARAVPGTTARQIGYGRTTTGLYARKDGYTDERKSAGQGIGSLDDFNVWTHGTDGGLCWGDSGGALIAGTNELLGVLADFDGTFDCQTGNKMIFTSAHGERDFLVRAIRCAGSTDPDCMTSCEYECSNYGYDDGECSRGWQCKDACLTYRGTCSR